MPEQVEVKLIADSMLGRMAKWLRIMGVKDALLIVRGKAELPPHMKVSDLPDIDILNWAAGLPESP